MERQGSDRLNRGAAFQQRRYVTYMHASHALHFALNDIGVGFFA